MKQTAMIALILLATGCATTPQNSAPITYRPIIDTDGVDLYALAGDIQECNDFTNERASVGQSAAAGAVAGGILGGIIMTAVTGNSDHLGRGVAAGALGGAARSASDARQTQKQIVRRCMIGRGYVVLD